MKFTRELQNRVENLISNFGYDYPQAGSTGVYLNPLIVNMIELTGNQQKLFWLLVASMDDYNQVHKNRKDIGKMYMKTYNSGNMSTDMNKLIDLELVAIVGNKPMVNPFIVLPGMKSPKTKRAIQEAWRELVEFHNV